MGVLKECFSFIRETTQREESCAGNKNIVQKIKSSFLLAFVIVLFYTQLYSAGIFVSANLTVQLHYLLQNLKSSLFAFLSQGI